MPTCLNCGCAFFPRTSAWGEEMCGHCIADRIEFMLSAGMTAGQRKPMRRATPATEPAGEPLPSVTDRQVASG